jgi:diacylglycerol kinase family enzyme
MLAQGSAEVIVDDGLLDVTIVAPADALDAIATAFDLLRSGFRRTKSARPSVDCFRTRRIKVETQPPQKVVLDGDLLGDTPIEVECIPGGLTLLLPFLPAQSSQRNQ